MVKKYNWYDEFDSFKFKSISNKQNQNFFKELYFFDLQWIKENQISFIKKELKKIFKNAN